MQKKVFAADLDNDNDLDVICSADDATGNGDIRWWKNNGGGAFTPMPYLATWLVEPSEIYANDLDLDGDMDIIGQHYYTPSTLFWFENDGAGNFSPMQVISDSANITSLIATDMDEDGDFDILYNSRTKGEILWAENLVQTKLLHSATKYSPAPALTTILCKPFTGWIVWWI